MCNVSTCAHVNNIINEHTYSTLCYLLHQMNQYGGVVLGLYIIIILVGR